MFSIEVGRKLSVKNVGLTNFRAVAFHIDEFHEKKNRSNVNICATESIGNDPLVQFPKNSSVPADLRNSMLSNFNDIPIGNDWTTVKPVLYEKFTTVSMDPLYSIEFFHFNWRCQWIHWIQWILQKPMMHKVGSN